VAINPLIKILIRLIHLLSW